MLDHRVAALASITCRTVPLNIQTTLTSSADTPNCTDWWWCSVGLEFGDEVGCRQRGCWKRMGNKQRWHNICIMYVRMYIIWEWLRFVAIDDARSQPTNQTNRHPVAGMKGNGNVSVCICGVFQSQQHQTGEWFKWASNTMCEAHLWARLRKLLIEKFVDFKIYEVTKKILLWFFKQWILCKA